MPEDRDRNDTAPNGCARYRRGFSCCTFVFSLYVALAIASSWPLAINCRNHIPIGSEDAETVPLFNAWTIWWNGDRACNLWQGYFDAPIFAPSTSTFLFSEMQPVTCVMAPLSGDPANTVLAYNLYVLISLTLNAFLVYLLVSEFTQCQLTGFATGTVAGLLPFVHWQIGVVQLIPIWPTVLTLFALLRFAKTLKLRWAPLLGSSMAWTYLSCNYYGLFLSLLLPIYAIPLLIGHTTDRRAWLGILCSAASFAALVSPIVVAQLAVADRDNWHRLPDTTWQLSARPQNYISTVYHAKTEPTGYPLSAGRTLYLLALAGILISIRRVATRRIMGAVLSFAIAAFLLSLGPRWHIFGRIPYMYLVDFAPGFAHIRSPHRAAVLVQLSLVILSSPAVATLIEISRKRDTKRQWPAVFLLCICCSTTLWEVWPGACPITNVPAFSTHDGWHNCIAQQTPEDCILLHLPVPEGTGVKDYQRTTREMFYAMWHRRRLANGYSGYFPEAYRNLKLQLSEDSELDSRLAAACLRSQGIEYCVVQPSSVWLARFRKLQGLTEIGNDLEDGTVVFRVDQPGVLHPPEVIIAE